MTPTKVRILLLAGTALAASTGTAHASQTTAGTTISNTASVSYTVNGTAQSTNSTTATFVVDRKVSFTTVVDQAANTQVNLGQTNAVATFKVTNTTNGTQDFLLEADQLTIPLGTLLGTDNFDMLNFKAYVDSNGNGVYDAGVDTATYIDELAPDASVSVFLVGDVPTTASANLAFVSLHTTVAAGGGVGVKGSALVATDLSVGNADNVTDIVFADDDSDGALYLGDIARNGQGRAYAAFEVGVHNVALTVTKSALVLSDGVNIANFKAIPGAVVQYCLRVNNATALTPANSVVLTDVIPANTTYVAGSVTIGAYGGTCVLAGAGEDDSTAFNSSTKTVTAHVGTVSGGQTLAAAFKVTIN